MKLGTMKMLLQLLKFGYSLHRNIINIQKFSPHKTKHTAHISILITNLTTDCCNQCSCIWKLQIIKCSCEMLH